VVTRWLAIRVLVAGLLIPYVRGAHVSAAQRKQTKREIEE